MFGNFKNTQRSTTIYTSPPFNHWFLAQFISRAVPGSYWSLPMFPSCRNIQTFQPQQPLTFTTCHDTDTPTSQKHQILIKNPSQNMAYWRQKKIKKKHQTEIDSARKNSESNIVNQLFSFLISEERSGALIQRVIKSLKGKDSQVDNIKKIILNTIRLINFRRGRKYVNKDNILRYYQPQNFLTQFSNIQEKLLQNNLITIEELCLIFRIVTVFFMKNVSITCIFTSKRIVQSVRKEHLIRRRIVLDSFEGKDK